MVELVPIEIVPINNDDIVVNINSYRQCPICLDELSSKLWTCKQCGGKFHIKCIREWKKQHINYPYSYTCPLCNYTIENRRCISNKVVIHCLNIFLLAMSITLISSFFYVVVIIVGMMIVLLTSN